MAGLESALRSSRLAADITAVETTEYVCPGCSGLLLVSPVEGFRHYVCASCGGTVITIAALRQLSRSTAQQLWNEEPAASGGTAPVRCPFCVLAMQPKAVPTGTAATCRACEAVWLSKEATEATQVKAPAAGDQPTLSSETLRCPQCGAPVSNSWDETCQYCGAGLHAPVKVVILPGAIPGEVRPGHYGQPTVLGEVLRTFLHGRP